MARFKHPDDKRTRFGLIAQRLIAGKTQGEIEKELGLAQGYVSRNLHKSSQMQETLRVAMDRAGISPERLARKLQEGLEATATKFYQKDGIVTDERTVVDYGERRQMVELIARLRGDLETNINVNVHHALTHIPEEFAEDMAITPGEVIDVLPESGET